MLTFEALTNNQQKFFDAYRQGDYFIGLYGSPGVGKTFLALYKGLEEVLDKTNPFKQVVVVRSAVQTRDQGFVPGTLDEKMEIYETPYKEICETLFKRPDAWDRLKEQGHARFISTTAIRGISIDDAIIVVDESQSMTFHELSSVISRVGHRSKIIFIGDLKQNDLLKSKYDVSGLKDFLQVAEAMKEYTHITFTPDDIVRSSLVKSWIVACDKLGF
jgi:predicted ribonuclease YlaK